MDSIFRWSDQGPAVLNRIDPDLLLLIKGQTVVIKPVVQSGQAVG